MATTYTLIASNTLSSSAASVTFSAIPNTFTDLVLKISNRVSTATLDSNATITFNGITTNTHSITYLYGNGASAASGRFSNFSSIIAAYATQGTSSTSNTFTNWEVYIPSYTASQNKALSIFSALENNATTAYLNTGAALWRNTAAISSITITDNFVSGSSFFLYGIKNS